MGLLMNHNLAKSLVDFSSPSDFVRATALVAAGEAKLQYNRRAAENKTAENSPQSAMLQGASMGMAWSPAPAAALFLNPASRYQMAVPGFKTIAAFSSAPITLAAEGVAYAVNRWACAPMLRKAEQLKDTPGVEGGAWQALAIATKAATLWYTEVPRLAFAAVYVSTAILCGIAGAMGGLLYYGAMNVFAAVRGRNVAAAPAVADAPSASTDVFNASSAEPEVTATP